MQAGVSESLADGAGPLATRGEVPSSLRGSSCLLQKRVDASWLAVLIEHQHQLKAWAKSKFLFQGLKCMCLPGSPKSVLQLGEPIKRHFPLGATGLIADTWRKVLIRI